VTPLDVGVGLGQEEQLDGEVVLVSRLVLVVTPRAHHHAVAQVLLTVLVTPGTLSGRGSGILT
jgi:hypothetical protein